MVKPKVSSSLSEKEMDKAEKQFEAFDNQIKEMTLDRMNTAPKEDTEAQTKISQKEIDKSKDVYLKPIRTIGSKEKFNETYRKDYEYATEYVCFIAENNEIIGEEIDMWTKPFAGMPAEEWKIPVNKPLWAPRHVAEQIARSKYHRLVMNNVSTGSEGGHQFYGAMAVDKTVQRLDARPASTKKSIFVGASSF